MSPLDQKRAAERKKRRTEAEAKTAAVWKALAEALVRRGHEVTLTGGRQAARIDRIEGIDLLDLGPGSWVTVHEQYHPDHGFTGAVYAAVLMGPHAPTRVFREAKGRGLDVEALATCVSERAKVLLAEKQSAQARAARGARAAISLEHLRTALTSPEETRLLSGVSIASSGELELRVVLEDTEHAADVLLAVMRATRHRAPRTADGSEG